MEQDKAKKIIIALDVQDEAQAVETVSRLDSAVLFKIGLELYTAEGPSVVKKVQGMGKEVFLDLKLHDIPNTVAGAVRSVCKHSVRMTTLHTSGGSRMMTAAAEEARKFEETTGKPRPLILGVTVLTSLKEEDLAEVGLDARVEDQVLRLAALAMKSGLDGIVCSPREIEPLRRELGWDILIVTPGIRPVWAAAQDQKRIMTPAEAFEKGADYLVIGRPITAAPSPEEAFLRILEEVK
jgi:orotidine-5'-phosphate decarboxylase